MIFENDAAGAWVALEGVEVPVGVIQHEVEAQLAARVGAFAELFNPVVYLPQPKRITCLHLCQVNVIHMHAQHAVPFIWLLLPRLCINLWLNSKGTC